MDSDFVKKHSKQVRKNLKKLSRGLSPEDLEDLTQETFILCQKFWRHYASGDYELGPFLWFQARTAVSQHFRKKKEVVEDAEELDFSNSWSEAMLVSDSEVLTETNSHFYLDNKDTVNYYLNLLPDSQRDKLMLRLVFGYTHQEIAEHFGITEGSSRVICKKATDNLKALLDSEEPEKIQLQEFNTLKPYGLKSYSGDWAWRYGETEDRCNSKVKIYTQAEIDEYILNKGEKNDT